MALKLASLLVCKSASQDLQAQNIQLCRFLICIAKKGLLVVVLKDKTLSIASPQMSFPAASHSFSVSPKRMSSVNAGAANARKLVTGCIPVQMPLCI